MNKGIKKIFAPQFFAVCKYLNAAVAVSFSSILEIEQFQVEADLNLRKVDHLHVLMDSMNSGDSQNIINLCFHGGNYNDNGNIENNSDFDINVNNQNDKADNVDLTELNEINFDEDIVIEDEYQKQQDRDYHDNLKMVASTSLSIIMSADP